MSIRRLTALLVLAALCLAPWTIAAQTPTPHASATASEPLFAITLPRDVLPESPVALSWEEIRVEPGTKGTLASGDRLRGSGIFMLDGEMTLTLPFEALVWQGEAAVDGDSTIAAAGEALNLAPGDMVYLPYRPGEVDSAIPTTIANDGEVLAHGVGFGIWANGADGRHDDPEGIRTYSTAATIQDPDAFEDVSVTFALDRITLEPGQRIQPDTAIPATFYQVIEGRLSYSWTTPDGETTIAYTWAPRVGRWMPWASGVTNTFTTVDDEPATLLILRVAPG